MNKPDPIEEVLSDHRLAEPSAGLRERALEAAADAWEAEAEGAQIARLHPRAERSPWWQYAAAAALVLFAGLNAIQAAGNKAMARESAVPPVARMADPDAEALAEAIGFSPHEVKRMLIFAPSGD